MALAPADFYAYSRATGVPVPEDPEERAQLAPEVLEFRRNQLKAPQQESNPLAALGAAAAGLGLLAGGLYAAKRFGAGRPLAQPSKVAGLTQEGISNVQAIAKQQNAEQLQRELSKQRPQGVVQTDLSAINRWLEDPGLLSEVELEESLATLNPAEARSELARQQARVQKAKREDLWNLVQQIQSETTVERQQVLEPQLAHQAISALESGEDQATGRVKTSLQRDHDLDVSQVELLENIADSERQYMIENADPISMMGYEPDTSINQAAVKAVGFVPLDQAEGLTAFDLRNKTPFEVLPRHLGQQNLDNDPLVVEALRYLRSQEIDTDFDYSLENKLQAAQVQDRIQKAKYLQNQANQILEDIRAETQAAPQNVSPEQFASSFNKQYREELNENLRMIDNARQRVELLAKQSQSIGEDVESLLTGEPGVVETTLRGKALRGGKPNIVGEIVYQGAGGEFASADTGLATRQKQGAQYEARARMLNQLSRSSDEQLTNIILQNQQALANNQTISRLDADAARMASQLLTSRAVKNPNPTELQLDALNRAKASIEVSQQILQQSRNVRPTVPPGPAQDVARSMETLRRAMIVEPSEPLPEYPSINQLRTGYVTDEGDIGPVLGASDVYTGAAREAAGPVIFTGKSKANTVLNLPPVTGSIRTPVGRYLTQDNPEVSGTVYNVAGTPANRAVAAQVERNAQTFLADALAGGLTAKTIPQVEPYRTPGTYGVIQFNLLTPPLSQKGLSQQSLGLTGPEASRRTNYAQYQPGRSVPVPLSPFIGELAGGTRIATPQTTELPITRRDIGAPSRSIDLTRRGAKARYYSNDPQEQFITGMEPAPIGPLTQSPGLSRIGGLKEEVILGAGNKPVTRLTTQGQKINYPRMPRAVTVPGYGQSEVTNIPRYGIDPGAEDWRADLMRSEFRRAGPLKTYQS